MSIDLKLLQKTVEQGESTTRDGINGAETKDAKQMIESTSYSSGFGIEVIDKDPSYQPRVVNPRRY